MIKESGEFIRGDRPAPRRVSEKKEVNLDALQQEAHKLLDLLTNRQPGLTTWEEAVKVRLQNLHTITSQALGK